MKKFIALVGILTVLLLASTCFAGEFDIYQKTIDEDYAIIKTSPRVLDSWKKGMEENSYIFDHLDINFKITSGAETTDGNFIIIGTTTVIGYCYNTKNEKVRILQIVGMAILLTKDATKILDKTNITDFSGVEIDGWEDKVGNEV